MNWIWLKPWHLEFCTRILILTHILKHYLDFDCFKSGHIKTEIMFNVTVGWWFLGGSGRDLLKGRAVRGGRDRALPSAGSLPTSCSGQSWTWQEPGASLYLPCGFRGSRIWATFCCFPKYINIEPGQSEAASTKWHLHRMPLLQAVALLPMPPHQPCGAWFHLTECE